MVCLASKNVSLGRRRLHGGQSRSGRIMAVIFLESSFCLPLKVLTPQGSMEQRGTFAYAWKSEDLKHMTETRCGSKRLF